MITPLFLSYAEIHYHLRYLYPAYFRRWPEIITDVPTRVIRGAVPGIPVVLIIKDAHRYPCTVLSLTVRIAGRRHRSEKVFDCQIQAHKPYFAKRFYLPCDQFDSEQYLQIDTSIEIELRGKKKRFNQDSFPGLKTPFFTTYLTDKPLPLPHNWFAGDPHYHSIFTNDQVEFGADLETTAVMARALGLSWFFVTDHSYDLDDCEDNCTRNDPALPIWHAMQKAAAEADAPDLRVIPGEEVSIGNHRAHNVHLLAVNHKEFIQGSGDSAERGLNATPTSWLTEIKALHTSNNFFAAAHAVEHVPLLQRLLLRRDNWYEQDFVNSGITHGQFINSAAETDIHTGIKGWKKLLLRGNRILLLAGNDAHGNFNVMRQIHHAFITLFASGKQTFGNFFTMFQHSSNDPVAGLKAGRIVVSNGPFIQCSLQAKGRCYQINDTCSSTDVVLHYTAESTAEKGAISSILLHIGDYHTGKEISRAAPPSKTTITLPASGYLRMQVQTQKKGLALTNPIWITT